MHRRLLAGFISVCALAAQPNPNTGSIAGRVSNLLTGEPIPNVLSSTAGKITGSVSDEEGKPFPVSSVMAIPVDGKSRPVKQAVDDDGNFKITNLRPGKYKLFAWEEVDDDVWQDPEFLEKYEALATVIAVGPRESQTAQLRVIPAEAMR